MIAAHPLSEQSHLFFDPADAEGVYVGLSDELWHVDYEQRRNARSVLKTGWLERERPYRSTDTNALRRKSLPALSPPNLSFRTPNVFETKLG